MKLSSLMTFGLSAVTAYKAYEKRHQIKNTAIAVKDSKDAVQLDLSRIKSSIATVQEELKKTQDVSQDLNEKVRIFTNETNPKMEQIKDRMSKYQGSEPNK